MRISASVHNSATAHAATVQSGDARQTVAIPAKTSGRGSAVNGGELLMLALATCYCNDLFREATRLGIAIDTVEVEASADFAGVGLAARDIRYRASVESPAGADAVGRLLRETDAVAEIHNTVRTGVPVVLVTA